MKYTTVVELGGKTATGLEIPAAIVEALGAGRRPPVQVTVRDHTYRTTVAPLGGRFMIPLSAEHRASAGVAAGDEVEVQVELDAGPREVLVPDDLRAALAQSPEALAYFDGLAYSHRKEWVRWIEDAKRPETRSDRITKAVTRLRDGHPRR